MIKLTNREEEVYLFILEYKSLYGYAPSIRDIAGGVFCSVGYANRIVKILQTKGYINYTPHVPRSIVISNKSIPI
ncbi:LexA repressor [Clostridioides difficile]|nr:LexA family transcriptional regulator [Clostridioides difficile]EGT5448953.1 LexA family transcriptional regulator [Clostridioides difficile]MCZ1138922.1 LexA repressor [Clostridioides difficile]MDI6385216.1 LexA repressor [Clostridioides difficile]HBG2429432.1 LexA repressor [Clostridioides difficile]